MPLPRAMPATDPDNDVWGGANTENLEWLADKSDSHDTALGNHASTLADHETRIETLEAAPGGSAPDASTTVKGIVELATNTEATTGTDIARAVTPAGVAAAIAAGGGGAAAARYAPRESLLGAVSPETVTLALGATYDTTTYNQGYVIASNTLPAEWPVDCFGVMSIASNCWAAKTAVSGVASVATYRFMCDGDKFGIFTYAGFYIDVYIDGKPYSGNPVVPAVTTGAGAFGFQTFSLGTAKTRLIELRMIGGLVDVRTPKPYRIWKPTPGPNPSVAVVGDSYVLPTVMNNTTAGNVTTSDPYLQGAYQRMAAELGISKMTSDGIGGTGYIAGGGGSTPYGVTGRRTWLNTLNPDVIIVHGGGANDIFAASATNAAIITAATTYFTNLRADHPYAKLVFVEGFSPPGFAPATYNPRYTAIRVGVQAALASAGIKAYFIDVATTHPPLEGAGYVTAPAGVGNNDIYVGSDTYHPTIRGHAYIRSFLAPKIARVLADNGALVGALI